MEAVFAESAAAQKEEREEQAAARRKAREEQQEEKNRRIAQLIVGSVSTTITIKNICHVSKYIITLSFVIRARNNLKRKEDNAPRCKWF